MVPLCGIERRTAHRASFAAHAVRALSGLSLEGEERDILREIRKGNREGKQEDTVARSATELRKSKGKSVRASEWSEHDGLLCFRDRIYVPNDPELRRRITSQHHDTRVAGHPGRWKDTGAHLPQLLVATDVPLHWPICENMRPLSPDQDSTTPVQPESFTRSQPRRTVGMSSVWISLWNFQTRMGTTQS